MKAIHFFREETTFQLEYEDNISDWLEKIAVKEGKSIDTINYIFCSDSYLHQINLEYLDHDTLTDIITFPYEESDGLEADIFISVDRVKENAVSFHTTFDKELLRVMAHGILHLCGYGDKSEEEKTLMRAKEDEYLSDFIHH